uniref:Uncharacterized protein n=1 Tax=Fagus sylvatica TaxID=28930 RepID=A0A2N9IPQ4_FAGSY
MVARARAHRFLAIESTSTSTPVLVGSRSGVASIAGPIQSRGSFNRGSSGPDLRWLRSRGGFDRWSSVQIWGGFDRGAALITGRLRSGEGSRSGSGRQSE